MHFNLFSLITALGHNLFFNIFWFKCAALLEEDRKESSCTRRSQINEWLSLWSLSSSHLVSVLHWVFGWKQQFTQLLVLHTLQREKSTILGQKDTVQNSVTPGQKKWINAKPVSSERHELFCILRGNICPLLISAIFEPL